MHLTAEMEQQKQKNKMAETPGKPTLWVVQSDLKNKKKEKIHSILLNSHTALAETTNSKLLEETRES